MGWEDRHADTQQMAPLQPSDEVTGGGGGVNRRSSRP